MAVSTASKKCSLTGIVTRQASAVIDGVATDVILQVFIDRIFIIVTQLKTLGTLIHAELPPISNGALHRIPKCKVLLGRRDCPISMVCARQLSERIGASCSKPLLLAIALKKDRPETTTRGILNLLEANAVWDTKAAKDAAARQVRDRRLGLGGNIAQVIPGFENLEVEDSK
eukprot:g3984.t1